MSRRRNHRLYLIEKRIAHYAGADVCKGPLSHLAKEVRSDPDGADRVVLYHYDFADAYHPIRAFFDEDRARQFWKAGEDDAWDGVNPFRYGRRADWTSLDAGRLRDTMLDIGLEPPNGKFDSARWRKWYDVASATVTELQKLEVRQALDLLHFFRVTELTA